MNSETIGERIAKLAKKFKYTQKELANLVGVTEAAMSRYLSNEREPKMNVIANLATALNTTSDYLISGINPQKSLNEVYRLVARGAQTMNRAEKMKLIKILLDSDE